MKIQPKIVQLLPLQVFKEVQQNVREIRRAFDWPGIAYHDADVTDPMQKFNRWYWHNLPLLTFIHHSAPIIALASEICGQPMKPSYCFLSMYGPEGVCPLHTDRPQCQFTIDLQISSNGDWPIYVDETPYTLKDGEALCYSGTGQPHYRKQMSEDSRRHFSKEEQVKLDTNELNKPMTFMNLSFFHFVPVTWMGATN